MHTYTQTVPRASIAAHNSNPRLSTLQRHSLPQYVCVCMCTYACLSLPLSQSVSQLPKAIKTIRLLSRKCTSEYERVVVVVVVARSECELAIIRISSSRYDAKFDFKSCFRQFRLFERIQLQHSSTHIVCVFHLRHGKK